MLRTVLVGGVKVDEISKYFEGTKIEIIKTFEFVEDAFNSMIINSGEFLDIDVFIVLQYGIKQGISDVVQLKDIQEATLANDFKFKLYYILKDLNLYDFCKSNVEDVIVYNNAKIVYLTKLTNKYITEVAEGLYDNEAIKIDIVKQDSDDFSLGDQMEDKPKLNLNLDDDIKENNEINVFDQDDEDKDGLEPDEKKSKIDFSKLRNKGDKDKPKTKSKISVMNLIGDEYTAEQKGMPNDFKGVLAVTGDRGSGVSSLVANIGELIALQGKSVLILDMDLEKRFQSVFFPSFNDAENEFTNTQVGVFTLLNNPDMFNSVTVVVENNLGLIGMSRDNKYYMNRFADKDIKEIVNSQKLLGALGVLKGLFDVVIIDFPIDYVETLLESTIIVDKFIFCVENSLPMLENLFTIRFNRLLEINNVFAKSILDKGNILLNKFNNSSYLGRSLVDEAAVNKLLKDNMCGDIKVLGRLNYYEDFVDQFYSNKRAVKYNQELRSGLESIINNLM